MLYLLETRGLSKVYKETDGGLEILKDVNFQLTEGSIVVLTGASGSGKSTFLNIVGALDKPTGNVIKCADWIIDLGPDAGEHGGYLVAEGTPEQIAKCKKSWTGKFLHSHI